MSNAELLAGLLAVIAPLVLALSKRLKLSKEATSGIVLAGCVVVAGIGLFVSGELNPKACASVDILECVKVVFAYLTAALTVAFVYYKMVWQALGIEDRIAGK